MADLRAPVFQSASTNLDGTKVILTYDEVLGAVTASKTAFSVKVGNVAVAVSAVAVNGATVELTLASAVRDGQAVTVGYRAPVASGTTANAAIQDLSGNDAATLSNRSVTNISTVDGRAPVFQSAATSADGTKVVLTYDEFLGATTASKTAFMVKVGGVAVAVSAVAVNGATVELTLARAVRQGQGVTVDYRAPVASGTTTNAAIQDLSGNDAATLSNRSVTNISTVDGRAPVFQSAATSVDGTKVILTYDEALGSMTAAKGAFAVKVGGVAVAVSNVAVNGHTVELTLARAVHFGQGVTVGYTAPKANGLTTNAAIQDIIGNDAVRLAVTSVTNAVNHAAVIGGATTGAVTEDAGVTLSTSGALTVSDVDQGQARFVAQPSVAGANGHGTFTLATNGAWSYAADNTQAAIQALGAGETLTDSFRAVTADGTTQVVTVTITGVNDAAVISGATTGDVTEDAAARLSSSGQLTVTDADTGEAHFVAQASTAGANGYGTFTLATDGAWSYAADNSQSAIQALGAGETLTDSFTAVTADGTTQTVTVTITGVNDTAEIGGATTGSVTEDAAVTDGNLTSSGTLTVSDADSGEAVFVALASTAGSNGYGNFTLAADGSWTYAADNSQSAIQALGAGETLTDSFTAVTADGTSQTVTVTITGVNAGSGGVFELSELSGNSDTSGFVIKGVSARDYSGFSVSSAGDVNGDGLDDLIIGAYGDDPNGDFSGASFVVFGKTDGSAVAMSAIDAGTGGFVINGMSEGDRSGFSVSSAGDVNGDGLGDLIIGAPLVDANGSEPGSSYVVFGKTGGTPVELSTIEAGNGGFAIHGVSNGDWSGRSVSSAGDVNGDGLDDLIVGARGAHGNVPYSGASYVVFSKADMNTVELSDIDAGVGGFSIKGAAAYDEAGFSVNSAGDVNGDGMDDLIIGVPSADPNGNNSGSSYVVFGKADGNVVELSSIEAGSGGFAIHGAATGDRFGYSVSSAGDVNGDGLADLIIGAMWANTNGSSYVVFGKADGNPVDLADVSSGTGGFMIHGAAANDLSGYSVSSAGDVNGDGLDDLIVGAKWAGPHGNQSGASYVVFGKADGATMELSDVAAGHGGFVVNGASTYDYSGFSVSRAGDVNGDGFADLIVGAPGSDPNGDYSGASFVVFGGDFTGSVTQIGTSGDDTLIGTSGRDVLVGGTGADMLIGGGGADVLYGGAGSDVLAVSDLGFARVDGGTGTDTLRLDGSGLTLDLTQLDNTSLLSVERINLGGGSNHLRLDAVELLRLSEASNTLRVLGDTGDGVTLVGTGWLSVGTVSDAEGTFDVFTDGNARIEIQLGIVQTGGPIAPVELAALSTPGNTQGFAINGVSDWDKSGFSVSSAGDVNGDGLDDVIIGAPYSSAHPNDNVSGASYVVFGKADGGAVELSDITAGGQGGFVINGATDWDYSGQSVSSAGDVNGDGLDDLIVGARSASGNGLYSGLSYVVFGKTGGGAVELSAIQAGTGGFVIRGAAAYDLSGSSVSSAGDLNGDGLDDLIIGASGAYGNGNGSGASYVVFGKTGGAAVELSAIETGVGGFLIKGAAAYDSSGSSVASAGDVNGDGVDDLIIGARFADPNGDSSGSSYVVFGKANGLVVDLSSVEAGSGGFVIKGDSAYDYSGASVSSAGDVNGDGLDDLIVGAWGADPNGSRTGASFVVFGKADGTAVELSAVKTGQGGFVINGVSTDDIAGFSVSSAGDVNGDGLDDLIVGAKDAGPNGTKSGASYVVFGKADGAAVELSSIAAGHGGFVINGASAYDHSGNSVSSAGDVNGDGFDDLIVGAPEVGVNGPDSGASFVVFGGDFTGSVTSVGTVGDDSLVGSAANDVIFAGTGSDTLDGGGGTDRLSGGAGADHFVFGNLAGTTTVIDFDGGAGDRLDLQAFGIADWTAFQALLSPEGPGGHDTRIALDADTAIVLQDVTPDHLLNAFVIF